MMDAGEEALANLEVNFNKAVAAFTGVPQGYPNVADNPTCAKSTVTRWYWNEDSATSLTAVAAAVTLAIIF